MGNVVITLALSNVVAIGLIIWLVIRDIKRTPSLQTPVKTKRKYTKRKTKEEPKRNKTRGEKIAEGRRKAAIKRRRSKAMKKMWRDKKARERGDVDGSRKLEHQNNQLAEKEIKKMTANEKRRVAQKKNWERLTPEQKKAKLDSMRRARELKKLLKTKGFHGPKKS